MGFFKKLLGDAVNSVKEAVEDKKNEIEDRIDDIQEGINQRKNDFQKKIGKKKTEARRSSTSDSSKRSSRQSNSEIQTDYGVIKNGTLEIEEGITELKEGSLSKYKSLKKVIFPASLTQLEERVFEDNKNLEVLDFSKVTKLEALPDVIVLGESKIKELRIPYGVKHVGCAVVGDIDRTHPLEVYVPATVLDFGTFASNNAVTFNLFTPNIDIEWLISDAKQFYVLEKDYFKYKRQMDEYDGDVPIGIITDRAAGLYYDLIDGPANKDADNSSSKEQLKSSNDSAKANTSSTGDEQIKFSPRIEALIKSAFRDGVLTKKEKEIIIKRAVAEGEDADEFELLLSSRIADDGIKEE